MAEDTKILVLTQGTSSRYWDISTPELMLAAYMEVFKHLDDTWHVYAHLEEEDPAPNPRPKDHVNGCKCGRCDLFDNAQLRDHEAKRKARQKELYSKAKAGNKAAALALVMARRDYEYEEVRIATAHKAT